MSLTSSDLTRMRATQEAHMMDECVILRHASDSNRLNEPVSTYTADHAATKCGLDMRPGSMRWNAQSVTLVYDATLRLPIVTMINTLDRIRITKRFGETLATALEYAIVGPVQRGASGIRLLLQRIEM